MKEQAMRRVIIYRMVILNMLVMMFLSCENVQNITVGVLWRDDTHFTTAAHHYLGIISGEFDSETGFEAQVIDQTLITVDEATDYKFAIPASSGGEYTAFVYADVNENGSYDDGYDVVTGYKYNRGEPGECLNISVSAFY